MMKTSKETKKIKKLFSELHEINWKLGKGIEYGKWSKISNSLNYLEHLMLEVYKYQDKAG
jgi:hypothetical protein